MNESVLKLVFISASLSMESTQCYKKEMSQLKIRQSEQMLENIAKVSGIDFVDIKLKHDKILNQLKIDYKKFERISEADDIISKVFYDKK